MNKRTFLRLFSSAVAGSFMRPLSMLDAAPRLTNWAGNIVYGTERLQEAASVDQIQAILRSERKLKVLGTRHCFNSIADSDHTLLSLKPMRKIELDAAARAVTVEAGVTYGQLGPYLDSAKGADTRHESRKEPDGSLRGAPVTAPVLREFLDSKGFALHNLASLPHISVAGACTTATHGSGEKNRNLAAAASALEMVTAAGDVVKLSRQADGDEFRAAVVGLGALGVIARITLDIEPTYMVRQYVYQDLPLAQVKDHFEEIQASGYSVSLFTDWQQQRISELWMKSRVDGAQAFAAPKEFFGATLATRNLHPIEALSAENCTEQMGVPGPWYDRLPHFRMGFTPSAGKELQSEYLLPRQHAVEAILAVERLRDHITPHLLITEIRTIEGDDLWMSTCYRQPSVAIHFTWKQDWPAVQQVLPLIERELSPFRPRPHWGKLFTMAPAVLQSRYERLDDFVKLAAKYDPMGKFRNNFLNTYLFTT